MKLIFFLIISTLLGCVNASSKKVALHPDKPLSMLMSELNLEPGEVMIHVNKSDYLLHIIYLSDTIKSYPVALGTNPIDPKLMEGDRCTPEGEFKIRDMYPHKTWSKFIWIDYPNATSENKFSKAKAAGLIPESAQIGGEVGIHGTPYGRDDLIHNRINWTHGCISVTQKAIDEIYPMVNKRTLIKIEH